MNQRRKKPTGRPSADEIKAAARILGRVRGLVGGPARARKLSPERRKEIASIAGKKGGIARRNALSPRRRSEIARQASLTYWNKKKKL